MSLQGGQLISPHAKKYGVPSMWGNVRPRWRLLQQHIEATGSGCGRKCSLFTVIFFRRSSHREVLPTQCGNDWITTSFCSNNLRTLKTACNSWQTCSRTRNSISMLLGWHNCHYRDDARNNENTTLQSSLRRLRWVPLPLSVCGISKPPQQSCNGRIRRH